MNHVVQQILSKHDSGDSSARISRMVIENQIEDRLSVADRACCGLTPEEAVLLQSAEEELERAKENYDKLASLLQKKNDFQMLKRRKRKNKRKKGVAALEPIESDANLNQRRASSSLLKRFERMSAKAAKSRQSCHLSDDELVQLYRSSETIIRFSAHLDIGLRKAINWLRKAGVDVIEEVSKEWDGGSSLRKLSKKHGPLPQTISNWIKSTGRQVKPRNSNKKYDEKRIRELCDEQWPTNKIAKSMGLSWATVQRIIDAC